MDLPDHADDVLGQPTRARLFEQLGDLRRPAGTEEMADRLGLHPNGVRLHLERMLKAGLLERRRSRQSVGRPRDMWSIAPCAQPNGDPPRAYTELGRWLAEIVASGKTGQRAVEATGRSIGRDLAPTGGSDSPDEGMRTCLSSLGFAPTRATGPTDTVTYRLCNCPYREVARENQHIVCTLHRGVTHGLLDVIAPEAELTAFVAQDPDTAGCVIEMRGMLPATATEHPPTSSEPHPSS